MVDSGLGLDLGLGLGLGLDLNADKKKLTLRSASACIDASGFPKFRGIDCMVFVVRFKETLFELGAFLRGLRTGFGLDFGSGIGTCIGSGSGSGFGLVSMFLNDCNALAMTLFATLDVYDFMLFNCFADIRFDLRDLRTGFGFDFGTCIGSGSGSGSGSGFGLVSMFLNDCNALAMTLFATLDVYDFMLFNCFADIPFALRDLRGALVGTLSVEFDIYILSYKIYMLKHALLVGIQYKDHSLEGPIHDVSKIYQTLVGYDTNVLTDTTERSPTKKNIVEAIQSLLQQKGTLFFYYSGHGIDTPDAILCADHEIITRAEFRSYLDVMDPESTLIAIFDTCFSGNLWDLTYHWSKEWVDYGKPETKGHVFFISSSQEDEVSFERWTNGQYGGVFTNKYVHELQHPQTWRSLMQELDLPNQTPELSTGQRENIDASFAI